VEHLSKIELPDEGGFFRIVKPQADLFQRLLLRLRPQLT